MTQPSSRREYYRLNYPVNDRPEFRYKNLNFKISNLSEKGLKFITNAKHNINFNINDQIAGRIYFKDGNTALISGQVIRIEPDGIVLSLDIGITLQRIMIEQRQLIAKYPDVAKKENLIG